MNDTRQFKAATQPGDYPVLILAAGFGKRLGELTKNKPKPLVEVGGKPLIDWTLEALRTAGFKRVFVNLHYLADQLREYLNRKWSDQFYLTLVEEPVILDTGGAIKNIEAMLNPADHLFTVNADTLFGRDFSFSSLLIEHLAHPRQPYATLAVRSDAEALRYGELGIDTERLVSHFVGRDYSFSSVQRGLIYMGIQVISPKLFRELPEAGTIFSITRDTYAALLSEGKPLATFEYSGFWSDVGTPERLAAAEASWKAS